jgi:hypothetical protein
VIWVSKKDVYILDVAVRREAVGIKEAAAQEAAGQNP